MTGYDENQFKTLDEIQKIENKSTANYPAYLEIYPADERKVTVICRLFDRWTCRNSKTTRCCS